jgi:hypothetical protein
LLPLYQVLSYTIFELVCGDMNKVLMAETEMKDRGDKTVPFIICKFSMKCAHRQMFIFWGCMLREKRIRFVNCFSSFRKNECLYDEHSIHKKTYPVSEPQINFYPKA